MSRYGRLIITASLMIASAISAPTGAQVEDRVLIGAYDPAHINGLVFITNDQNFFALRFLVYRPGAAVEESPQKFDLGPHAPNGGYAGLKWYSQFDDKNPIILRWSRANKNIVFGRLTAPPNVRVAIEVYRPRIGAGSDGSWANFQAQSDRRTILGEKVQSQRNASSLRRFFLRTDRAALGAASYEDAAIMRKTLIDEGYAQHPSNSDKTGPFHQAALSYDLSQETSIGFTAMVGNNFEEMEREADKLMQRPVAESLDQAEKSYDSSRPASGGALGEGVDAITRLVAWNRFYDPERQLEYIAIHRLPGRRQNNRLRSDVLSWETFFTAMMAGVVDRGSAKSTVRAILEGQTPDGRIPLRRYLQSGQRNEPATLAGRSMPPIGALCVWKVYLATNDLGLLAYAYPHLLQWNEWWLNNRGDGLAWRDGNGDGLLEWGFDPEPELGGLGARTMPNSAKLKMALSESGLDYRPEWIDGEEIDINSTEQSRRRNDEAKYNDRTRTVEFSPVALNALYALDTEILILMARELGLTAEIEKLQARHERIRDSVNNKLWSEEDGLYLNRHWDGRFSRRLSLENFYPLIAGLADEDRARRMMKTLIDPKKFWGDQLLPFISRSDPAFASQASGRGAVWSLSNYLIYAGLRRYGFNDEAAEAARKSLILARNSWEKSGRLDDYYSSEDGRAIEEDNAERLANFGGLMFWPGVEEVMSADPWAGLSFGSAVVAEESRIDRVVYANSGFDVVSGRKRTVVRRDGKVEVECEGPVRLRAYRANDNAIVFAMETKERVRVLVPAVEGRKITVSVDEKVLGSTSPGASASFKVPAGAHKVFIVK